MTGEAVDGDDAGYGLVRRQARDEELPTSVRVAPPDGR